MMKSTVLKPIDLQGKWIDKDCAGYTATLAPYKLASSGGCSAAYVQLYPSYRSLHRWTAGA